MRSFVLSALFCLSHFLFAQGSSDASFTFKGSYHNIYLFRGHVFNDDTTAIGAFGAGIARWSYDLIYVDPLEQQGGLNSEYNHTVTFTTASRGRISTLGYTFYDYDGLIPDTQEIFFRVSHTGKWNPTYGLSFDFDTYKGYYLDYSLTRNFPFSRRTSFVASLWGGISYNLTEERNESDQITEPGFFGKDGFNHASALLKYAWQPADWLSIETGLQYHYAFDDFLYDGTIIKRDNTEWRSAFTIRL